MKSLRFAIYFAFQKFQNIKVIDKSRQLNCLRFAESEVSATKLAVQLSANVSRSVMWGMV